MLRHFAWFERETGRYLLDRRIDVPEADIDPSLTGDERLRALNAWQQDLVGLPGSVCLDVTPFDYPEGDFCWMVFREHERLLDWPDMHTFVEIDPNMRLSVYAQSPRPIRPSVHHPVIVDITGTALEAHYREHGPIFGQFVVGRDGAIGFRPDEGVSGLPAMATLKVLEAAAADLDPIDVSTIQQPEGVLVSSKGAAACHQSP